jgi:hypothetical protein
MMLKNQRGQALVMALILVGVGGVLAGAAFSMIDTSLRARSVYAKDISNDYAAESAIEYGMWRLKWEPGFAASLPVGEESTPFEIIVNDIAASTVVLAEDTAGETSGQELAGPAKPDIFFKVEKTVFATTSYTEVAFDGFESGDGTGGTGPWTGDWTFSGEYDVNTSGEYEGTYHLRLRNDSNEIPGDGYAERQVNLSTTTLPYLQFWAKLNDFEQNDNDHIDIRVSTNGTDWDILETLDWDDDDNTYRFHQYDLTSYGTPATFYVSFDMFGDNSSDTFWVDNIEFTDKIAANPSPGVVNEYTYTITVECMDPDGCTSSGSDLAQIRDELPRRGAASGDYLQYIPNTVYWDEQDWGIAAFEPSTSSQGFGTDLRQRLDWNFSPDIDFDYGQTRTLTFNARAALTEGVYCNYIEVSPDSWNIHPGVQSKITIGSPSETRCSGALLELGKTTDTPVIYPDEETTITYTMTIENADTLPITVYEIEDWLPSSGVADPTFVYVAGSANASISRPSFPLLFYDTFSRADSNTVSAWTDGDGGGADCRITNEHAQVVEGCAITKSGIDTTGVSNIIMSYDWQGFSAFAYDGFESGDASGGTGTWLQDWTLTGNYQLDTSDEYKGIYSLELRGDNDDSPGKGYAQRHNDASANSQITLGYRAKLDGWEGGDELYVKVSTDGIFWDTIKTFVNGEDDDTYRYYEHFLFVHGSPATFYVAFESNMNNSNDSFWVDELRFIDWTVNKLTVEWKENATSTWNTLAQHNLNTDTWQPESYALPAGAEDTIIDIRFSSNTSANADIDNVKLKSEPEDTAFDGWESGDGTGGTGTWNGNWTLSGDHTFSTSGVYEGTWHLRLRHNSGYAERSADISGFSQPYLRFWGRFEELESNDTADVMVSTNGTDWDVLETFDDDDDDDVYHQYKYDLSSYATTTDFHVAFDTDFSSSNDYMYIDNIEFIDIADAATSTPICLPDDNEGTDLFTTWWDGFHLRNVLEWDFSDYPAESDAVWDAAGACAGYEWADYDPYVDLLPGEIMTVEFQAIVTLTATGSYYNEFFVWIESQPWGDAIYSFPTSGVSVPQYDLSAATLTSLLRSNVRLRTGGVWLRSWHWWRHR